jgi:hypothetical protein
MSARVACRLNGGVMLPSGHFRTGQRGRHLFRRRQFAARGMYGSAPLTLDPQLSRQTRRRMFEPESRV